MALVDTCWYVNFGNGTSTGYYAVTVRPQNTAVAAGVLRRQFTAPAVGSERVFVCIVAGTTANVTDATWVLTRGAKTTDGTATWMECTGQAALNGDLTNTATWAQVKAATPAVLGQVIKRSNNASYQICTTAGAMSASEPAFSDTAGTTTTDTTAVWTSLGVVGNFTGGQAPHARLAAAIASTWYAVGNTIYVGGNHAETQASAITITVPGSTAGLVGRIICHDQAGSYPPTSANIAASATVSTTGSNGIAVIPNGAVYVYGIAFKNATGASSAALSLSSSTSTGNQIWTYFDNCSFQLVGTGTAPTIQIGSGTNNAPLVMIFNNCTVSFSNAAQYIQLYNIRLTWQNTGPVLAGGSSVPTALFNQSGSVNNYDAILEALDLSQLTGSIFGLAAASIGSMLIKDCKLNATTTNATPMHTGTIVQLVRSSA